MFQTGSEDEYSFDTWREKSGAREDAKLFGALTLIDILLVLSS